VAAARDQAELILRQALMFIRHSPALQVHMRVMRREIQSLDDGGRVRVLASDEDTADGVMPTLAIVDELHRHRTGDLYTVLRLGLGARDGRIITISTAGATSASPLGELRRKSYEMEGFVRDTKRRRSYVKSPDGAFVFIEWCLNPDDDPDDIATVKKVNPRPGRTLSQLTKEHDSPMISAWEWLRFACGIWTEGQEPWVDPAKWDALEDPTELAAPFWVGVGLGHRADTAALVKMSLHEGEVTVRAEMLTATSLPEVEARIRELAPAQIVYGSKLFQRSADMLEAEGFSVIQYPLTPERLIPASGTLHGLVAEGKLHHDGDAELRAQVLAGRVKETETGWRFAQDPTLPRPIDALMALAIGAHVMLTSVPEPRAFAFAWT
jgi:phage terminase large subunit-like protein